MIGTIIIFILILAILVLAHEAGHFFTARKMGMKVEEFGFGFPPKAKIWKRKSGLAISLNWLPLGGFVKIKGEDGSHFHDHDSFAHKKAWQRFIVLVAGVAMNFVLAAVLLSFGFMVGLPSAIDEYTPSYAKVRDQSLQVMSVVKDSPASRAGLEMGDKVVSINEKVFDNEEDIREYISVNADQGVIFKWEKPSGEQVDSVLVAEDITSIDLHGVGVGIVSTGIVSLPVHYAIVHGVTATGVFTYEILRAFGGIFKSLFAGQGAGAELSGPVGIAVMTGKVAEMGFSYLLQFTAMLSINLAILNILPFPALDGGRILFLVIEKLRRKTVDQRTEAIVHNIGFMILMLLVVIVTLHDVIKFGGGFIEKVSNMVG
ncbi:MAG: RIP metalloprotease RseP [Patescibacteria group bacterium]